MIEQDMANDKQLLWKRIESNCAQVLYEAGEGWCRLALHQIFEKAGEMNKGRISR